MDDEVHSRLTTRAAQGGQSIDSVVEDAVRAHLFRLDHAGAEQLPDLVTFTGSGLMPGIDLDDNTSLS